MRIVNNKIVEFVSPDDLDKLEKLAEVDKPEGLYTITLSATLFAKLVRNEEILLSQYAGHEEDYTKIGIKSKEE